MAINTSVLAFYSFVPGSYTAALSGCRLVLGAVIVVVSDYFLVLYIYIQVLPAERKDLAAYLMV